jgi:hypothetical protein
MAMVRSGTGRAANLLATLVFVASLLAALFLIVYIILVAFSANGHNEVVKAIRDVAQHLVWVFKDLFTPKNMKIRTLVNYGIAAAVYLVVGRILVVLLRLPGRRSS